MHAALPAAAVPGPLVERSVAGLHAALLPHLPPPGSVCSVLDIGCGSGAWLARLNAAGYRNLTGIDLDIAQFAVPGVPCLAVDLDHDEMPIAAGSIDLITAIELVEHLHNPGRLFKHAARLLSAQGCMVLSTPNVESVIARLRFLLTGKLKQFDDIGDATHVAPILRTCLERMLHANGLQIDAAWGYPSDVPSLTTRPSLMRLAAAVRRLVPAEREGDVACYRLRRA